jgi:hypothetical protein
MESTCHVKVKRFLCTGNIGVESRLSSGRRIDCRHPLSKVCYEIELHKTGLKKAVSRLVEGLGSGHCLGATLITKDKFIPQAQQLVGTSPIKVVRLSALNKPLRLT